MKIRTKLVLLSAILIAACGFGLLGILAHLTATRFLEAERGLALADLGRVVRAVERETETLRTFTSDWANWDDMWQYVHGSQPTFEKVNLDRETYTNAHLDGIAIYDAQGRQLYGRMLGPGQGTLDLPFSLPMSSGGLLQDFKAKAAGIIRTPQGLMLAVSAGIFKSDRSGPCAGTLVMGRLLDADLLHQLSEQVGVPFQYALPSSPPWAVPADWAPDQGPVVQADPSGHLLYGFQRLLTTRGTAALVLRTSTPRPIAQAQRAITATFAAYFLLLVALVWLATSLLFRHWVSTPLQRVESSLGSLDLDDERPEAGQALRGLERSPDELGHITGVLQGMYLRMRASHLRAKRLNESLESEVEARTAELAKAHQRLVLYGRILENTSEGMLITDQEGTILEANDAMCSLSGYSREELLGRNPRILKSGRHSAEFYRDLWAALTQTGYWSGEIWDRRPNGEIYPKWLTINAINGPGGERHYVGLSIDISAIKSAEERLHHMAYYDQLTGLPNRAMFNDRLRRVILRTQRKHQLSALLFLDLDRFKNINDTFGHKVGDGLLLRVADRIKSRLRESDTVCRMGGDEFTVILAEIARVEDAGQVASELIDALGRRFDVDGIEIYVGASVGIALCPMDGRDDETLVKKADAAMYAAKEGGRSTFRFASGEMDTVSRRRMEIEARLHGAEEREELVLHYQPVVRAAEARPGLPSGLVGAEALLRWEAEPGVVVGPGTFIQIAEDAGIIQKIGTWAIGEACRQARRWLDQGLDLYVSVNLSARQFEDDRLPEIVRGALETSALPARLLRLEITESAFLRNLDKVIGIMDRLRAMGVLFSIDDFGTGFSSLQYIKCLPAHGLKIDKAFVSGVAANLSDAEIVSAIISLARAFGLSSTAEGVETEDQLKELRERGCVEIQGYLVARPMPAGAFMAFAAGGALAAGREPGEVRP